MKYTVSLTLNKDFKRLYYRGKFKASPVLVTYILKCRGKQCRMGITVSKKIGKAVVRNRVRRIIKAAYREVEPQFHLAGYDVVFVARSKAVEKKSTDISREMKKQLGALLAKK